MSVGYVWVVIKMNAGIKSCVDVTWLEISCSVE